MCSACLCKTLTKMAEIFPRRTNNSMEQLRLQKRKVESVGDILFSNAKWTNLIIKLHGPNGEEKDVNLMSSCTD